MPPKEMVPVLPEWCDCYARNRCPKRSCVFLGSIRIALALTCFILCAIFAAKPYSVYDEHFFSDNHNIPVIRGILITICVINVVHIVASIYLIYMAKSNLNNTSQLRRWLIVDLIITGLFVFSVLILLFTVPPRRLCIILGLKYMVLSLVFCYRSGATYYVFKNNEQDRVLVHVASADGAASEIRYDNVYRV